VPTVFFEEGWAVQHLFKAGAKKTTSAQGLSSCSSWKPGETTQQSSHRKMQPLCRLTHE